MTWLDDRARSTAGQAIQVPVFKTPWVPALLSAVDRGIIEALTYAVIDERDGSSGNLLFLLSPWPRTDALGRVRPRPGLVEVGIPIIDWQAVASTRRVPEELRQRAPRIGDVFAVMLNRKDRRSMLDPIGPIADVTEEARHAARAAFYGAVAAPLDGTSADNAAPTEDQIGALPEPPEWRSHLRARR